MQLTDEIKNCHAQIASWYILLIYTLRHSPKFFTPIVINPTLSFWLQLLLISLQNVSFNEHYRPYYTTSRARILIKGTRTKYSILS